MRDLTNQQFAAAMRRNGFKPQGFLGYWEGPKSGVCMSAMNYPTRRAALAGLLREDADWAKRKAAKATAGGAS